MADSGGGAVDYSGLVTRFKAGGRGRWRRRRAGKKDSGPTGGTNVG